MAELNPNYYANIPATQAVTAPAIQIYVQRMSGDSKTGEAVGTPALIGAVMSYDKTITRNMTRRVASDSPTPGQTIEIIPGALTDFTIRIKRAMLSSGTMMTALGYNSVEDLIRTNTPLQITERRFSRYYDKNTSTWRMRYVDVLYKSCFLKSYPTTTAIDGDWIVIQDCDLEVAMAEDAVGYDLVSGNTAAGIPAFSGLETSWGGTGAYNSANEGFPA